MAKMNDIDRLARDVAFEIVLGGDRFDPSDLAAQLDGISRQEMRIFQDRIRYHAVDFAPPEYRTDDFLNRMISAWTDGVALGADGVRQGFLDTVSVRDRGEWFRMGDGSVKQCRSASVETMWRSEERKGMEEKPVAALEVAKMKAGALLDKYGHETMLDRPCDTMDIDSYGMTAVGYIMSVRRDVDILANSDLDKVFFVTITTPSGMSSTALSDYKLDALNEFIALMDTEKSFRESASLMVETSPLSQSALIGLPENTVIAAPEVGPGGLDMFRASSVFIGPDGTTMVSGRFSGQNQDSPEYNYRLSQLSDKSVDVIRHATDAALKNILQSAEKSSLSKGSGLEQDRLKNEHPRKKNTGNTL